MIVLYTYNNTIIVPYVAYDLFIATFPHNAPAFVASYFSV